MASTKNRGPKRYFSQVGGETPLPQKFIAAMNRRVEIQPAPNDVGPEDLGDEIIESKCETDRTNERVRTTIKKKPGNIVLADIRTNSAGQPVQVTLTLFPTGTPPSLPNATTNVAVEDLGNGWSIQEVAIEGAYIGGIFVPGLFQEIELYAEQPDRYPTLFQAATHVNQNQSIVPGTVVMPTLGLDQLKVSEKQITVYKKLLSSLTKSHINLPVSFPSVRTNTAGQLVAVTDTLRVIGSFPQPPSPDALTNVSRQNLGEGHEVMSVEIIPQVFDDHGYTISREEVTPLEFRTAIPAVETSFTVAGQAVLPTLVAGDLSATQKQITAFTKLSKLLTRAGVNLPFSLVGSDTNDKRQFVTITRTLQTEAAARPGISALREVVVQNLGDGRVLVTTREIAATFPANRYSVEIPEQFPPEFRYLFPTKTTESIQNGDPLMPTLGANDIAATQEQLTAFTKLVKVMSHLGVDFTTGVSLLGKDTNDKKQDVVITRTIRPAGTDPVATPLLDVVVQNLGNINGVDVVLQTLRQVSSVFPASVGAKAKQHAVPSHLRPFVDLMLPSLKSTSTLAAAINLNPTLALGDLSHTERQVANGIIEKDIVSITPVTGSLQDAGLTREFGGVQTITFRQLTIAGTSTMGPNAGMLDEEIVNLGNGYEVHVTTFRTPTIFPLLTGMNVDDVNSLPMPFTEQVVNAGSVVGGISGGTITEVQPLDQWRDKVTIKGVPAGLSTVVLSMVGSTNVDVPPQLTAVTAIVNTGGGGGAYNSGGNYQLVAPGSASISMHGMARASSAIMFELDFTIKQLWGRDVPVLRFLFFMQYGTTRAQIITRLGTLGGGTVLDWPKFTPHPLTFICKGQKASIEESLDIHAQDQTIVDFQGTFKGAGQIRVQGQGIGVDLATDMKVNRTPPVINQAFSVTGVSPTSVTNNSSGGMTLIGSGLSVFAVGLFATAFGTVVPISVSGSGNQQTIPTSSSYYLHRLVTEPYKNGYQKVMCDLVRFDEMI